MLEILGRVNQFTKSRVTDATVAHFAALRKVSGYERVDKERLLYLIFTLNLFLLCFKFLDLLIRVTHVI